MALVLCVGLLVGHLQLARGERGFEGVFGGPLTLGEEQDVHESSDTVLRDSGPTPSALQGVVEDRRDGVSLHDRGRALGIFQTGLGILSYRVQRGDTLGSIAAEFGVSVQTLMSANPELRGSLLRIGQELSILPVSGVVYIVRENETAQDVASLFGVSISHLREFNRSADLQNLSPGMKLIIPGAKAPAGVSRDIASLPSLPGYFALPAEGFNWGKAHDYNAVDIANTCGADVRSAAEGIVIDSAVDGWNDGYGHFILVEHPNSTQTRYAHLGDVIASVGDYVQQGDRIGTMGNTGNVHGPTGCHLHFEVVGARNPFTK